MSDRTIKPVTGKDGKKPIVIHVNSHAIKRNKKVGKEVSPVARVRRGRSGKALCCREVAFEGKGRLVYSPDAPLPCGAVVWLEIDAPVVAIDVTE